MSKIESLVPIEHNDRRVLLTAQLAEMYGTTTQVITNNFNRNRERYTDGVDYICLTGDALKTFKAATTHIDLSQSNLNKLYLWTEHGALLHAKSLGTDEAWATYGKLVDIYFESRHAQAISKADKPSKLAREMRERAMLINAKRRAAQDYRKLYEAAGVKPEYQIMALQDYMGADGPTLPASALAPVKVTYDKGTIAKRLGVYSKTGLPHAQAIGAIIGKLGLTEEDMERVPFSRNGHDGFDVQYTDRVAAKAAQWLEKQGYPATITGGGKTYHVSYKARGVAS